jgi:NSS family neurotransmitter:Na+ symporter
LSQEPISRGQWKSRVGFILAASGSAIGLGNIVFFSASAYKYGGGAFYLPYLFALFMFGIPVMILEFGLGNLTGRAFPESLHRIAGRKGEFIGWWANLNAGFITMYYITILSWVIGMFFGAFGALWRDSIPVPAFGMAEGDLANPYAFFFNMLSTWKPLFFVAMVWIFNVIIVRKGAETIESATKVFVPLMWIFMIVLIIRGVTLPNGIQGVYLLFTPNFSVMKDPAVWQGAFAQTFFSLSLGFGIMTAYASYLPKKSDLTSNSVITALLDSGFAYVAGLAVFSILFAFAIVPQASTLGMMFFILPQGLVEMPGKSVVIFGVVFFALLLIAGLTSTVSLVEALVSSLRDKFGWTRKKTLIVSSIVGFTGSAVFALPQVVNPGLENDGTLGLTLLDLTDHWTFSYGLLIVGLCECILVGWVLGPDKIRMYLNENSKIKLGVWFDVLIKYLIPLALLMVLGYSVWGEYQSGIFGSDFAGNYSEKFSFLRFAPKMILLVWLLTCSTGAVLLARRGTFGKSE